MEKNMDALANRDIENFLKEGFLTKPFLGNEFVKRKVDLDFNNKIINNPNYCCFRKNLKASGGTFGACQLCCELSVKN